MKKIVIITLLLALVGCNKEATQKTEVDAHGTRIVPAKPATPKIKPENLVRFPTSVVACLTQRDLSDLIEHYLKGEKTKMVAMVDGDDKRCVMIASDSTYKVLSVQYGVGDSADIGMIEIIKKDMKSARGLWTGTTFGVEIVSEQE